MLRKVAFPISLLLFLLNTPSLLAQKSAYFDGSKRAHIYNPNFASTSVRTIEFWVNPEEISDKETIWNYANLVKFSNGFLNTDGRVDYAIEVGLDKGYPYFSLNHAGNSSEGYLAGNDQLKAGEWAHLAFTYDEDNLHIYVNGKLSASKYIGKDIWNMVNSRAIVIGASTSKAYEGVSFYYVFDKYFEGKIDELRIWNTIRTQQELIENRHREISNTTPGLVQYANFNEGKSALENIGSFLSPLFVRFHYYEDLKGDKFYTNKTLLWDDGYDVYLEATDFDDQPNPSTDVPTFYNNGLYTVIDYTNLSELDAFGISDSSWHTKNGDAIFYYKETNASFSTGTNLSISSDVWAINPYDVDALTGYLDLRYDLYNGQTLQNLLQSQSYVLVYAEKTNQPLQEIPVQGTHLDNAVLNFRLHGNHLKPGYYALAYKSNSPGGMVQLDGINDAIHGPEINLGNKDFTVEFWAQHLGVGRQPLFSHDSISSNSGIYLEIDYQDQKMVAQVKNETFQAESPLFGESNWNHYAVSYEKGSKAFKVFANGYPIVDTLLDAYYVAKAPFSIGYRNKLNFPLYLQGNIDLCRIWNTAKNQVAIRNNMNRTFTDGYQGLIFQSRFDQDIQNTQGIIANRSKRNLPANVFEGSTKTSAALIYPLSLLQPHLSGGYAIQLDGSDDYIEVIDNGEYENGANGMTVETWVKPTYASQSYSASLVSKKIGTANGFSLSLENGKPTFHYESTSGAVLEKIASGTEIPLDQWSHIAATYSSTAVMLYVNGVPVAQKSNPAGMVLSSGAIVMGKSALSSTQHLNGQLDEVRLWNTAKSMTEVIAQFGTSLTGLEPNLLLLTNFDLKKQNTILDAAAYQNHGAFYGNTEIIQQIANWSAFSNTNLLYQNHLSRNHKDGLRISAKGLFSSPNDLIAFGRNGEDAKLEDNGDGQVVLSRNWNLTAYDASDDFNGNYQLEFIPDEMGITNMSDYLDFSPALLYRANNDDEYKKVTAASATLKDSNVVLFEIKYTDLNSGYFTLAFEEKAQGYALAFSEKTSPVKAIDENQFLDDITDRSFFFFSSAGNTFQFWVNPPSQHTNDITYFDIYGKSNYSLIQHAGSMDLYFKTFFSGSSIDSHKVATLSPHTWQNITVSSSSTSSEMNVDFFVNGIYKGTETRFLPDRLFSSSNLGQSDFSLGHQVVGDTLKIDELRVYNKHLGFTDVQNTWSSNEPKLIGGLVGHYSFNEINTTIQDQSGEANDLSNAGLDRKNWVRADWFFARGLVSIDKTTITNRSGGLSIEAQSDLLSSSNFTSISWQYNAGDVFLTKEHLSTDFAQRLSRYWKVDKLNNSAYHGTATFSFDIETLGLDPIKENVDYHLLYTADPETDFTPVPIFSSTLVGGTQVEILANMYDLPSGYYSLGITSPRADYALPLDGSSQHLQSLDKSEFSLKDSFTIAFWLQLNKKDLAQPILSIGEQQISLTNKNELQFESKGQSSSSTFVNTNTSLTTGKWYHVALVYKAGTARFILNGSVDASTTAVVNPHYSTNPDVKIGSNFDVSAYGAVTVDELSLWTKPLTSQEISDYSKQNFWSNETGLVGYWRFNEHFTFLYPDRSHTEALFNLSVNITGYYNTVSGWIDASNKTGDQTILDPKNLDGKQSTESGGLIITSKGFLHDPNDDVTIGYVGSSNQLVSASGSLKPGSIQVQERSSRNWYIDYIDQYGNGGLLDFTFDFDKASLSESVLLDNDYYLLYSSEGKTNLETVATLRQYVDEANQQIVFTANVSSLTNGYYSLGTASQAWGQSLQLDGANDYLTLGTLDAMNWDDNGPFTILAQLKPYAAGTILSKTTGENKGIALSITADGYIKAETGNSKGSLLSKRSITFNQGVLISFIYDGDSIKLYTNGKRNGASSVGVLLNANSLEAYVGANSVDGKLTDFLAAEVDDIRIYNRALEHYENTNFGLSNPLGGDSLKFALRFNQNSGTRLGSNSQQLLPAKIKNSETPSWKTTYSHEYVFGAANINRSLSSAVRLSQNVNELAIASDTTGNQAFFKNNKDNIFFGYTTAGMLSTSTQIPESIEGRYAQVWKVNISDYQRNGGKLNFTFKGSKTWSGPEKDKDYFLLFSGKADKTFNLLAYNSYSKNLSDSTISFDIDALQLKSGYYSLGYVNSEKLLNASDTVSDANIYVSYKIPANCLLNIGGKPVKLEMENEKKKVVYELVLDSFSLNSYYEDSFIYYADAGIKEVFNLNIYRIGSGNKVCEGLFIDTGSTKKHIAPQLRLSHTSIDRIELDWQSNSDQTNKYRLIRIDTNGDSTSTFIDSTLTQFTDSIHNGIGSLENGERYTYCLQAQSTRLPKFFQSSCITAHTPKVNFTASDAQSKDTVWLQWSNLSSYCDQLTLTRDGSFYANVDVQDSTYVDPQPVHGKRHVYGLEMYRSNSFLFNVTDSGHVSAKGTIAGRVVTLSGEYAVPQCKITARASIGDSTVSYTTSTDETGYYELTDVYFGTSAIFNITPEKTGHSFERSTYTASLSSQQSNLTHFDLKSLHVYQTGGQRSISGFQLQAGTHDNFNRLNWNYSSKSQTLFQIYRDDTLLSILSDTGRYDDLKAFPGKKYNYQVNAYILSNDSISLVSKKDTLTSGKIRPINTAGFTALANTDKATVQLSWEYNFDNYDGFSVFRNGIWIADTKTARYEDWTGLNNTTYTYDIAAFKNIGEQKMLSKKISRSAIYPSLTPPTNMKLSSSELLGEVKGNFLHSVAGNYNFDGFIVWAVNGTDTQYVTTIEKGRNFLFQDTSGNFTTQYTYLVASFKGSITNRSSFLSSDIRFPDFANPDLESHTEVSNGAFSYRAQWRPNTSNYSGTRVITETDTLWLPKGRRALTYSLLPPTTGASTQYQEIRTYVWKEGKRVFSDSIKLSTTLAPISTSLKNISEFKASTEFAGFVLLSWEYPDYIKPEFRIYRDGVLIDSTTYEARTYSDFNAEPGKQHAYLIQAVYPKDNPNTFSQYAIAYGSVNSKYLIYGELRNKYNFNGIANAQISIQGRSSTDDQYYLSTQTDSTGYYELEIPKITTARANISVVKQNIKVSPHLLLTNDSTQSYRVDFIDTTRQERSLDTEIAQIERLLASANETNQSVSIRFNLEGRNYTGVRINRGNKTIATLLNGEGYSLTDQNGTPGFSYVYSVQVYWETNGTTKYSRTKQVVIDYPGIQAPSRFKATANDSLNRVKLEWAHPNDRLDAYILTRNGEKLAEIPFGTYVYYDLTGQPGKLYRYSIHAQTTSNEQTVASESLTAKATYPYLPRVYAATATASAKNNAISLSWNYSVARTKGYIIQRNGYRIDTVFVVEGQSQYNYLDKYGLPGIRNQYTITPYLTIGADNVVKGVPALASAVYPKISAPSDLISIPKTGEDKVNLLWDYTFSNIDGFIIYRDGNEIDKVSASTRFYEDEIGLPGNTYTYSVAAYAIRNESVFASDKESVVEDFPLVGTPSKLRASTYASQIHILLNWKHDGWLQSFDDERGYEIEYHDWPVDYNSLLPLSGSASKPDEQSLGWVPLSQVGHTDRYYVHKHPNIQNASKQLSAERYRIRAYRKIGGSTFYSEYLYTDKYGITLQSEAEEYAPTSFEATDGDNGSYVKLTWKDQQPSNSKLKSYKIYRKGFDATGFELIATVAIGTQVYNDDKGIAGKKYIYEIRPELLNANSNELNPQRGSVDVGWRNGNGSISGNAIVYETSSPLEGVNIEAVAQVGKELFIHKTTTDQNGQYSIGNVFFGNGATYEVTASYLDHEFSNPSQNAELTESFPSAQLNAFVDLNAFVVKGRVTYKDTDCGLDSVKMSLTTYFNDGSQSKSEQYTDENGDYAIVYNPRAENVRRIVIQADTFTIFYSRPRQDTVHYSLDTYVYEISNPLSAATETTFNIAEKTVTPVNIELKTACGPLPHKTKYSVLIQSNSGCFNQTFETDVHGQLQTSLTPGIYEISIIGADPVTQSNYPYVQYFSTVSRKLRVAGVDTLPMEFVYHKKPSIKYRGLSSYCGNDATNPAIVDTENPQSLQLEVLENHGTSCQVSDGFLIIYNDAVQGRGTQRAEVDTLLPLAKGGFPNYTFLANNPNVSAPYQRSIRIEYHTEDAGYQTEVSIPLIVEGTALVDGNDVVVNPSENGNVKLPLFVLRDPPGDNSYSYISKGTTFSQELEIQRSETGTGGIDFENKSLISGVGLKLAVSYNFGRERSRSYGLNLTTTITEELATGSDDLTLNKEATDFLVGGGADVIVGAGLASQSGLSWKIKVEPSDGCKVQKLSTFATGIGNVKTTWVYTVDHIRGLITEYEAQLKQIEAGTLSIEGKTREEALSDVNTYIANWKEVLRFHENETLPHYSLCDALNYNALPQPWQDYLTNGDDNPYYFANPVAPQLKLDQLLISVPDAYKANVVKTGVETFCKDVGSYTSSGFEIDPDFKWTSDKIAAYNGIYAMIENWESDTALFLETLNQFKLNGTLSDDYWSKNYTNRVYPEAENITFSGAASYTKELTSSTSKSRMHFEATTYEGALSGGVAWDKETEAGVVKFKNEGHVLLESSFGIAYENSTVLESETEKMIGYELADSDPGDQFSVTVVRGIHKNHTPYFSLLGGRSSCPYEEGTIDRDQYTLELADSINASPTQRFLDPDEPAIYKLKITNLSPFNESRWFGLYLNTNSNRKGARIEVYGNRIGADPVDFFIKPGQPEYFYAYVYRAPGVYAHEDIVLDLMVDCDDYFHHRLVRLKAYWQHECTDVDIISNSGWVINKSYGGKEQTLIELGGYDVENEQLQRVLMKYRREGDKNWTVFNILSRDSLKAHYERFLTSPPLPARYPVVWDITHTDIPDGNYEIMAEYVCSEAGVLNSNIVTGMVNRSAFTLQGKPLPADGMLSLGENISATYNKNIDCAQLPFEHISSHYLRNGKLHDLDLKVSCFNNSLHFHLEDSLRAALHGKTIYIRIDSLYDENGNNHEEAVEWAFTVNNNPFYWSPAYVSHQAYAERTSSVMTELHFARFENALPYQLEFSIGSWASVHSGSGILGINGQEIKIQCNTRGLATGTYYDTLWAKTTGYDPIALPIALKVSHRAPHWYAKPTDHEQVMHVIANFEIDNNGLLSTDTMDRIAAYVGSELRGVGNIMHFGSQFAAYLPIYGGTKDQGQEVQFRVWDASAGVMYSAEPAGASIIYDNKFPLQGSFTSPRILQIDALKDSMRILPLKAGWNWISTNLKQKSIPKTLSSLNLEDGDLLKTAQGTNEYSSQFGPTGLWLSTTGLSHISPERGYQLYLSKDDTLYVSGDTASTKSVSLSNGWNLIGYPRQKKRGISAAFTTNKAIADGDMVYSQQKLALYDAGEWKGTLDYLRPFEAYKVRMGKATKLSFKKTPRPESWSVNPHGYQYNMTITGRIVLNGKASFDSTDLVGAFVDDELRGVGYLKHLPAINKYRLTLFVYSDSLVGEKVDFKIYDSDEELLFDGFESIPFEADARIGKMSAPYTFSNEGQTGIEVSTLYGLELEAFPNPFKHSVTVSFTDKESKPYQVIVQNALGQRVRTLSIISSKGENQLEIDFEKLGLKDGMYFIQLDGHQSTGVIRIIKQ